MIMNNKITASITFNFKGETLVPTSELNLDELMQRYNGLPPLHDMLAAENNIDSHSYQYEMLLGEDIHFNDAQGDAIQFFNNGKFNQAAFEQFWLQKRIINKLQKIVQTALELDDIEQHPRLKQAMLMAFQCGQDNAKEQT